MRRVVATALLCLLLGAACAEQDAPPGEPAGSENGTGDGVAAAGAVGNDSDSNDGSEDGTSSVKPDKPKLVDPRKDGFEITLGEWAVTPESPALRPGRVTFVIHNRGTMDHGFEIELEGDSSGHGSGDLFKAESELLSPGESTRMTVRLMEGVHKIECLVDGHDDMGMEGPLEVSKNAPLVPHKGAEKSSDDQVAIEDFSFAPATMTVPAGTEIIWRNEDPTQHTVTAEDGSFDSDVLDSGADFAFKFDESGTFAYICNIHPDMKGTVKVE